MNVPFSDDPEAKMPESFSSKRGNWITFPFIIGTTAGLTLAGGGWVANLMVYLIKEFNVKSIDAAQISNVVNGCISLFPVVGAIIADSFFGSFSVIIASSCISLLGTILLSLTALLDSLRPEACQAGSRFCQGPSKVQFAVLFSAIAVASIGLGGSRFTIATMGANQFDKPDNQGIFFNWYLITMYSCSVISATAIVYVEDNVSWSLGFGLCVAANLIGLAIFLLGKHFYRHDKPQGSPFVGLARVVVAAIQKRKVPFSSRTEDYYHEHHRLTMEVTATTTTATTTATAITTTKCFRFLDHAALKAEGDIKPDGSIANPWRLCSVQQVEDLKTLVRIFPLWSSSILLSIPIAVQASLTVLQILSTDRHLGQHFQIPAGSILVIELISTSVFLTLVDSFISPLWRKLTGQSPTPLQQIGLGHVLNVLGMAVSALVESRRLKIAHAHHDHQDSSVPMLALWLFPQLILVGIGEAFHFPGQVALYYQEFPASLRSTATAMIALHMGLAFYLSTALIDLVRRVTTWLPDNINNGRIDSVYWMLAVAGVFNFFYYIVCAKSYKYRNGTKATNDSFSGSDEPSQRCTKQEA